MKHILSVTSLLIFLSMTQSNAPLCAQNLKMKVNGAPVEMIKVKGGTYVMGDHNRQNQDALPLHSVTLSTYYVGRTEVTQQLWEAVMGYNNSTFRGPLRPVETIDYEEIELFLQRLNSQSGVKFRLLTEAEWEFAARGGVKSNDYIYSGSNELNDVAWTGVNNPTKQTHNVANKAPNELGIYDMTGNVWEWCSDYNGAYSDEAQTNPTGPTQQTWHQARGGSYSHYAYWNQVCYRDRKYPADRNKVLGFRLAMDGTEERNSAFEPANEWYLTAEVVKETVPQSWNETDIVNNPTHDQLFGVWQRCSPTFPQGRRYGIFYKILHANGTFDNLVLENKSNLKCSLMGSGSWQLEDNCLIETVNVGSANAFEGKKNVMELILSENGKMMHIVYINIVTGARQDEYYEKL